MHALCMNCDSCINKVMGYDQDGQGPTPSNTTDTFLFSTTNTVALESPTCTTVFSSSGGKVVRA